MKLHTLLHPLINIKNQNTEITSLTLNSKEVQPGSLFFAVQGTKLDGRDYIQQAIEKGASAIVYENADGFEFSDSSIPCIGISQLPKHISEIAAKFYDYPSRDLLVIGITGTNGKSSCCHYIAQCLQKLGRKPAVMGTLGNGLLHQLTSSRLTTEDAINIQKSFAEFKKMGADTIVMEASSHGLEQGRLQAVEFKIVIFTNLTQDHLDYHKTMQAYAEAKALLFQFKSAKYGIVNLDDDFGMELAKRYQNQLTIFGFTQHHQRNDLNIKVIRSLSHKINMDGTELSVETPWGNCQLSSNLIGGFNIANLLTVMSCLLALEIPLTKIDSLIKDLKKVPGRIQMLTQPGKPYVVVDYAHTPDALEKILISLKELMKKESKIWCVFGCGGNRDKGKRPQMTEIAVRLANHVILTNDNPRDEDPKMIIKDMLSHTKDLDRIVIELDRAKAIAHAIIHAREHDVVLIAGKGHENYQIVGKNTFAFDDALVAKKILGDENV